MEYYELIFSNGYIAIVTAQTYEEAVKIAEAIASTTDTEILHVLDKLDI